MATGSSHFPRSGFGGVRVRGVLIRKQDEDSFEIYLAAFAERLARRLDLRLTLALREVRNSPEVLERIRELLVEGRIDEAVDVATEPVRVRLSEGYTDSYTAAGRETASRIEEAVGTAVAFDITNVRAVEHMRRAHLRLITGFTQDQRDTARRVLAEGTLRGDNPRVQALGLQQSTGLTPWQQRAVNNYSNLLQGTVDGDTRALSRSLRDKRFDRTVGRAARDREPLTQAQIDRMTRAYRENYVRFRTETIARTEALRATHEAQREAFEQAIESGKVDPSKMTREWVTAEDERVRKSHVSLNGYTLQGNGGTFPATGGPLRYPLDPMGPPEEVINCRCALAIRLQR